MTMDLGTFFFQITDICTQKQMSLQAVCTSLRKIGFRFVEMDCRQADPATVALLSETGLQVSSLYVFLDFSQSVEETVSALLTAADRARPRFVMPIPVRDDSPELRNRILPVLRDLAKRLADRGIRMIMENYDGPAKSFASARGLCRYLEDIPGMGCCFDTGNFLYTGEDLFSVWPILSEKVIHVHFKDRRRDEKYGPFVCTPEAGTPLSCCAAGEGVLHLQEFAGILKKNGYRGIIIEEHAACFHQFDASRCSFCNIQKWFSAEEVNNSH